MRQEIEMLVSEFEKGEMGRRDLVGRLCAISMLMAAGGGAAAAEEKPASTFKAVDVNHLALNTPDLEESRDFYVKHLGLKVVREGRNNCFMTCGGNFLALFGGSSVEKAGMNHFCFSVEDYKADGAEETLAAAGLKPRRQQDRLYFQDPHGLTVQISAEKHMP